MPHHDPSTEAQAAALVADASALVARENAANLYDYPARLQLAGRAYALLDQIAAERGIRQEGPAWDALRECRAIHLRERQGRYPRDSRELLLDTITDPAERLLAGAYGMLLAGPEAVADALEIALRPDQLPDLAAGWTRDSMTRTGQAWYGEDGPE